MVKMAASTSSAAAHVSESSGQVPVKFHPLKGYSFPVRTFGTKGEKRSFR